nr:oligosaccharide flippase family protein [uncultured Rhodopila sp.]
MSNDPSVPTCEQSQATFTTRRVAYGALAVGFSGLLKGALQLVVLPVVARLLGPEEFGLYALALPTIAFLQMLADSGLAVSLAREADSSEDVWSTAFWAVCGLCTVLAALVSVWSFVLAGLSNEPRLPMVMVVLSGSLFFIGAAILPNARLMREARLGAVAAADLISNVTGVAVGLALAFGGAGVWSLVAQYLSVYGVRALVLNIASPRRPRLRFRLQSVAPYLGIGSVMMGIRLADFGGRQLENALISRTLGAPLLGAYSFGNQIARFICEAVSNPAWTSLYIIALRQDSDEAVQSYYRVTRVLALLLFPTTLLIAVSADRLVPIMLGSAWSAAAPTVSILLPSYAVAVIGTQSMALLYAYGRSAISFWMSIIVSVARVLAIAAAPVLGLPGAVICIGVINVIWGVAGVFLPARLIGVRPMAVVRHLAGPLLCSTVAALLCRTLLSSGHPDIWGVLASITVSMAVAGVMLVIVDRRRVGEDLIAIRMMVFQGKKFDAPV